MYLKFFFLMEFCKICTFYCFLFHGSMHSVSVKVDYVTQSLNSFNLVIFCYFCC